MGEDRRKIKAGGDSLLRNKSLKIQRKKEGLAAAFEPVK